MTNIPVPQEADSQREVVRGIDAEGRLVFKQVGFQELDFGAVFGGKTTSGTENTIGYGTLTFTLDTDDGKLLTGHTVQITSLADEECFMYGVVLTKTTITEPAQITVYVHTISAAATTSSDWEIQVVEVTREITLEVADTNATLSDEHRVIFYTTALTAARTLTLSSGATLMAGTRLLVVDVTAAGAFTTVNTLTIAGVHVLNTSGDFSEFIWTGSAWKEYYNRGYFWGAEANSPVIVAEEFDNGATAGPLVYLVKNSASPAISDGLGGHVYQGKSSTGVTRDYGFLHALIVDPTNTSEDGALVFKTAVAGSLQIVGQMRQGVYLNGATGDDMGAGTLNATALYVNGNSVVRSESGTYTPTLTEVANLDASAAFECQYVRNGSVVTVSGRVTVDPTAAAATELGISLPIASNFAQQHNCGGTAASIAATMDVAGIVGDAANDRASMQWITNNTANHTMAFSFTYRII